MKEMKKMKLGLICWKEKNESGSDKESEDKNDFEEHKVERGSEEHKVESGSMKQNKVQSSLMEGRKDTSKQNTDDDGNLLESEVSYAGKFLQDRHIRAVIVATVSLQSKITIV